MADSAGRSLFLLLYVLLLLFVVIHCGARRRNLCAHSMESDHQPARLRVSDSNSNIGMKSIFLTKQWISLLYVTIRYVLLRTHQLGCMLY